VSTTEAPPAAEPPASVPTGDEKRRVKTPTVLQMEALECGAAALGIVLAHYGRWVPLEKLRADCGVSRDGSRASNVAKAARSYGLEAKGKRIDPEGLTSVTLPAIIFWNFNHFVVVEGYGPKGVYLNDPAGGPRFVTWDEFEDSFTGIVITLEPTDELVKEGSPQSVVSGLSARFQGSWSPVVLCLLAGVGLLIPGLLVPATVRIFVNEYLGAGNTSWLWLLVIGVGLAAVAQMAFTWLQQITLLRLSTKLAMSMSTRFFEHVMKLPLAFFGQRYAGHVVTRVQTNDQIASLLSSQLSASLLAMLTSAFYLVLMAIYDWQLTIVAVVFATGNLVALRHIAKRQKDINRRLVQDTGKLTSTAASGLSSIETLKATSEDASFFARWAGQQAKVVTSMQSLGASSAALSTLPMLLSGLNNAVVLGVGGWQVMSRDLSLGTLTAFQMLVGGFTNPITQIVGSGSQLQQMAGNLASVDDVLDYPADSALEKPPSNENLTDDQRERLASGRLSGALELKDISFGYNPLDPPLIEGFSMKIEPGQRVAVVGSTGSGKSTVAKIVAGLNRAWSGEILFDGIPRESIPRNVLAATVALVDQDIKLFEGTARDNLTLWDPTIAEEAMVGAAHDAAIHADIVKRPDGYERPIEEGGRDWSGGQRQRLEIARAMTGDPNLLILDEATSALDPLVEQQIDERLRARGCSCLIVAHRLSTIRDADEIIVLDHGKVVERGTHEQLVALDGAYAKLVNE
jgi:NHLM bacteriocin system ABC transporter peptidase/ATP-binding protein